MKTMPWFRVYSEVLDDRKIKRIRKDTGQGKAIILGLWISLLSLANESPERGKLLISPGIPYTLEDIASETDIETEILDRLITEFRKLEMINGDGVMEIKNWNNRQFKSDNSTERVKKSRMKNSNVDVTETKRYKSVIDTDTEEETDTETEQKQNRTDTEEEGEVKKPATTTSIPSKIPLRDGWQIKVISTITGMLDIPGSEKSKVLPAMDELSHKYTPDEMIIYLIPYWESWKQRKRIDGQPVSKSNFSWLYDWAIAGEIPPPGRCKKTEESSNPFTQLREKEKLKDGNT